MSGATIWCEYSQLHYCAMLEWCEPTPLIIGKWGVPLTMSHRKTVRGRQFDTYQVQLASEDINPTRLTRRRGDPNLPSAIALLSLGHPLLQSGVEI